MEKVLTSKKDGERRQERQAPEIPMSEECRRVKSRKAKHLTTQDSSK